MQPLSSYELTIFLFTIGLMLILARIISKIGQRFKVPTLVAELIAGILLGPTFFGLIFPDMQHFFFPTGGGLPQSYDALFNLSVIMLLFYAGMELNFKTLQTQKRVIAFTSAFAIFVPFLLGVWFGWQFFDFLQGVTIPNAPFIFPLTFGTIIAISSLPIITRILMNHDILNTPVGICIIGTALVTDLIGWFSYSSILTYANSAGSLVDIIFTLISIGIFFLVVFYVSGKRSLMDKIFGHGKSIWGEVSYDMALLFGLCLFSAAFTNAIHIHASLGAFIAGIVCRRIMGANNTVLKQLEVFILNFFAPIFFISIGLKLNFIENFNALMLVAVFVFACISKVIAAYVGAKWGGFNQRSAWATAFGLNARGSMEIIMGALALQMGLISKDLFVAIVIVAIATSFVAEYALLRILKLERHRKYIKYEDIEGM